MQVHLMHMKHFNQRIKYTMFIKSENGGENRGNLVSLKSLEVTPKLRSEG